MKLPLLVIAGPTGVGKTAAAVALARRMPLEVVSADSRQVYRFMDVATGKPTPEERAAVTHHLVDIVEPDDRYQAARAPFGAAVVAHGRELGAHLQGLDTVEARYYHSPEGVMNWIAITRDYP